MPVRVYAELTRTVRLAQHARQVEVFVEVECTGSVQVDFRKSLLQNATSHSTQKQYLALE